MQPYICAFHALKLTINCLCHSCCCTTFLSLTWGMSFGSERILFYGKRLSATCPTPNLESHVIAFCVITFDLSGIGDPINSCAATSVALRVIWPHKPHHCISIGYLCGETFESLHFLLMYYFFKVLFFAFKVNVTVMLYAVTFNLTGGWIKYWPGFWIC